MEFCCRLWKVSQPSAALSIQTAKLLCWAWFLTFVLMVVWTVSTLVQKDFGAYGKCGVDMTVAPVIVFQNLSVKAIHHTANARGDLYLFSRYAIDPGSSHHHFLSRMSTGFVSLWLSLVLVLVNGFWISSLWRTKNGEHEPYEWGARTPSVPPVQFISIEEFCVAWEEKSKE